MLSSFPTKRIIHSVLARQCCLFRMKDIEMSALNKLKEAGKFNKEMAAMSGRMVPKNLARRQKDFELMNASNRKSSAGFHRPGSNKK